MAINNNLRPEFMTSMIDFKKLDFMTPEAMKASLDDFAWALPKILPEGYSVDDSYMISRGNDPIGRFSMYLGAVEWYTRSPILKECQQELLPVFDRFVYRI